MRSRPTRPLLPMRLLPLLLVLAAAAGLAPGAAAQGRIAGTVKDDTGETLPGANIVVVGTAQGATSDIDGLYEIRGLRPGSYNIQASYIGYETQAVHRHRGP